MTEPLENQESTQDALENKNQQHVDSLEAHFDHEEEAHVLSAPSLEEEDAHDDDLQIEKKGVEELFALLKELLQGEIQKSASHIKSIKSRFQELMDEKKSHSLASFLENGGLKEEFDFVYNKVEEDLRAGIKEANERIKQIRLKKDQEEQKNLSMKIDLIDDLKRLIEDGDISQVQAKFKDIQDKWNSIGHVPREKATDLWNSYKHQVKIYYDALSIHRDLFKMELEKNLETKEAIVKKVENLMNMESIKKSQEYLQMYHKEWRETGPIPKQKSDEVWDRFKSATEAVYKRSNEFYDKVKEQRKENLEEKKKLIVEIEEWAKKEYKSMKEFNEAQKVLDTIEQKWRTIGRVPESVNEEIWSQFREAKKTILQKRGQLWDGMKNTWKENLSKKMSLIEKAEELAKSTDWKNTPAQFKNLQEQWKKVGAVQKDKSDAIWDRFRAAADTFFNSKEEHHKNVPIQEKENLEKKKSIIAEMEAYIPVENLQDNMAAMDAFVQKYKSAGFVPFNDKKSTDEAFDKASQAFWSKLNIDPNEKDKLMLQGSIDALLASSNPYESLKTERNALRTKIEKLRQESSQLESNLTFFGSSKNADSMKKPYLDKIARNKDEIQKLESKLQLVRKNIKPFEDK